eukprot:Lithocolla_globosa_v1_NODE_122_length_6074_cov_8.352550.p8 type:complete len:113 gc:universal NODE_122_length_6074_cov_8.352550:2264-2602(+)
MIKTRYKSKTIDITLLVVRLIKRLPTPEGCKVAEACSSNIDLTYPSSLPFLVCFEGNNLLILAILTTRTIRAALAEARAARPVRAAAKEETEAPEATRVKSGMKDTIAMRSK